MDDDDGLVDWSQRHLALSENRTAVIPNWAGQWRIDDEVHQDDAALRLRRDLQQLQAWLAATKTRWELVSQREEVSVETGIGVCTGRELLFRPSARGESESGPVPMPGQLVVWQSTCDLDDAYYVLSSCGGEPLLVGIVVGHPFVVTRDLAFDNSDGSTIPALPAESQSAEFYLTHLLGKAEEFVFQQQH